METQFEMQVRGFLARPPFGYRAVPEEDLSLFCQALTHDSAGDGRPVDSYERLEFLGDAVLELLACEKAFQASSANEGDMTAMKQDWVKNSRISDRAMMYGLDIDGIMRVGGGHIMPDGKHAVTENMRADCFEAILAAIYLTRGMDEARRIASEVIFSTILPGSDEQSGTFPYRRCRRLPSVTIIDDTAEQIRSMKIRGAGRIARAGAKAIGDFADGYSGKDLVSFKKDLDTAVGAILGSRPTAVSLWNGVHATIRGADSASSIDEARDIVSSNAKDFCKRSEKAVEEIARIGARRIQDGDVIMTHCNSSAALGVIKEAHRQGKAVKVYATESRPWRQGILTVNELADAGVDITLIIDSAVRTVMKKTDKVFVGADTVTSQGALINKVGTSQLALAASEARVSFFVCAETYKFSPMTMFGDTVTIEERETSEVVRPGEVRESVKIFNPVFDSTPPRYIDAIVTELGMMGPGSVYDVMVRQLGEGIFKKE